MNDSQAYRNGSWFPLNQLTWSVTDVGTTHGAILVERLRTLGGRLFALEAHLDRLAEGAAKIGIAWSSKETQRLAEVCRELLDRNIDLVQTAGDVGLVLVISPGDPGIERRNALQPTVMAHLSPIPFGQLADWYRSGTALHLSSVRNVPKECWSPSIKTRSRLQYFLADQERTGSVAVLLSTRCTVTETSISNLLVLGQDDVLRSPPLEDILWGVSLHTVLKLAETIGLPVEFCDLDPESLRTASEVLMTGSTGCLWSAVSIDGKPIGDGKPGRICRRLQSAWEELVGYRFTQVESP